MSGNGPKTNNIKELPLVSRMLVLGQFACLLANHGVIALGPNLAKALWLANEVEILAKQYSIASQYGKPVILTEKEMNRIIKAFKSYGQK